VKGTVLKESELHSFNNTSKIFYSWHNQVLAHFNLSGQAVWNLASECYQKVLILESYQNSCPNVSHTIIWFDIQFFLLYLELSQVGLFEKGTTRAEQLLEVLMNNFEVVKFFSKISPRWKGRIKMLENLFQNNSCVVSEAVKKFVCADWTRTVASQCRDVFIDELLTNQSKKKFRSIQIFFPTVHYY